MSKYNNNNNQVFILLSGVNYINPPILLGSIPYYIIIYI